MKNLLFILSITFTSTMLAQTVPSSCNAPDSIKQLYQDDADRMALRYTMDNTTTWKDSAQIEPARVQQYMDALMAIYNATTLPARDTVIDLLKVHTQVTEFALNVLELYADSNLTWMQAYMNNNYISGTPQIDSLMKGYNLDSIVTFRYGNTYNVSLLLYFGQNKNLFALGTALEQMSGVVQATPHVYLGGHDGGNITDTSHSGYMEITYQYGWVDCIIECWYHRYWVFRVYPDCSVEYVRSYGDILPANIGLKEEPAKTVSVYPNPFTDRIHIENLEKGKYSFGLYTVTGQKVQNGVLSESSAIEVSSTLPRGHYFLKLSNNSGQIMTFQLVK